MHDFSLGAPVDVGEYAGPLLDGEPIHRGNCEDGVYGCRMCNSAARRLTDEQRRKIGWETDQECDYCHDTVPITQISGLRPYDEPSIFYEVCSTCRKKHDDEARRELESLDQYGED